MFDLDRAFCFIWAVYFPKYFLSTMIFWHFLWYFFFHLSSSTFSNITFHNFKIEILKKKKKIGLGEKKFKYLFFIKYAKQCINRKSIQGFTGSKYHFSHLHIFKFIFKKKEKGKYLKGKVPTLKDFKGKKYITSWLLRYINSILYIHWRQHQYIVIEILQGYVHSKVNA